MLNPTRKPESYEIVITFPDNNNSRQRNETFCVGKLHESSLTNVLCEREIVIVSEAFYRTLQVCVTCVLVSVSVQ